MQFKKKLIHNLTFSSAILLAIVGCGKSNQPEISKNNEEKNLDQNYALYEKNQNLSVDIFSKYFMTSFQKLLEEKNLSEIDKIKEVIQKFSNPNDTATDENKYNLALELAKVLPEPNFIEENQEYTKKYNNILDNIQKYYEKTAVSVPKILHFVWLGGPMGEPQRDYIRIWAKLNPDYRIHIWYDSDHLTVHESNKKIKEYLNYSLAEHKNADNYQSIFANKFVSLQNDLFEKLNKVKDSRLNNALDIERLKYLEQTLYQKNTINTDEVTKKVNLFYQENEKFSKEFSNIKFQDFKEIKKTWALKDIYDQEMLLRGNFAAAGDSVRVELLRKFGGVYADIDVLPAIKPLNHFVDYYDKLLGGKSYANRFRSLSVAFCEQIFNQFKFLSPSRKVDHKFKNSILKSFDYDGNLNTLSRSEHKSTFRRELNKLKELKNIEDIFTKLGDVNIRQGELKAAEDSNSVIASHPKIENSDWIEKVKDKIIQNYGKLNAFEINNPKFYYTFDKNYNLVTDKKNYKAPTKFSEADIDYYIQGYRKDTLLPDYRITVKTSGPGVMKQVYEDLYPEFVSPRGIFSKNKIVDTTTQFLVKNNKFTNATEEDVNSSWATRSKSRDNDMFGQRRVILPLGQEENIKNAAELIHKKKEAENKKTSLININDLTVQNKDDKEFEKVNLYLVGHAEKEGETIKIGNLTAEEVATKLLDFTETNKNQLIDYIDIISCNPSSDSSDTTNIVQFTQDLMKQLDQVGISIDIISVRKSIIKIDDKGNELSKSRLGLYEYANDADKIFIIRKSNNEFLTINTSNIVDLIQPDNLKKLNRFNGTFKNILSKKTQELGEFNDILFKIKDQYYKLHPSRRNSENSVQLKINNSNSSINSNSYQSESDLNKLSSSSSLDSNKSNEKIESLSNYKRVAKYSFNGIEKFTSVTNKYNIFMNLLNTPKTLQNIKYAFENDMILDGVRESANFGLNNADLVLDLVKFSKGNSFWQKHATAFSNMNKAQIGINFASAGLDIWQAADLFKSAENAKDQEQKLDYLVNASFTTARAATSIGTAILLPLSAKSGPIGAAIGYTIMFSQGTYNAVRTSQELRKLGFKEEDIALKSILNFFGQYEKFDDPAYITRIESNKLNDEIIPNILNEKNNEFFNNIGKPAEKTKFYFNKIVYPKIDLYIPYTFEKLEQGCAYGVCVTHKTPGKKIDKESHSCLTNNSHFERNNDLNQSMLKTHLAALSENQSLLAKKQTGVPSAPKGQSYSQARIEYHNNTVPCPNVSNNVTMIEKKHNLTTEQQDKLSKIPDTKKANLYLLGFGDQGKHGNMIHTVSGETDKVNLFNIHSATYMVHLLGGDKEDIFEFYDTLQTIKEDKGYVDGGLGIDTISFEGIKDKNLTISLDINQKSKDLPLFKNIENVFGSNNNDHIIGNALNNFISGNGGDDKIEGGNGEDTILPGIGFDHLIGGEDSDNYIIFKKDISNNNLDKDKKISEFISSDLSNMDQKIAELKNKLNDVKNKVDNLYVSVQGCASSYHYYMNILEEQLKTTKEDTNDIKKMAIELLNKGKIISENINQLKTVFQYSNKTVNVNEEVNQLKLIRNYLDQFQDIIKNDVPEIEKLCKSIEEFRKSNLISEEIIQNYRNYNEYHLVMSSQYAKDEFIKSQVKYYNNEKNSKFNKINNVKVSLENLTNGLSDSEKYLNLINQKLNNVYYGYKIINNFDDSANKKTDIITTDIKDLVSSKIGNDLQLGFYHENEYVSVAILKNYFLNENYQHIMIMDLQGNRYSGMNGELYDSKYSEYKIDTINFKNNKNINLDQSPEQDTLLSSYNNVIGSQENEIIHGNASNNFIFGNGGFDKINGFHGNDSLSIEMSSNIPKDYSDAHLAESLRNLFGYYQNTELIGGTGHDNYILNFEKNESFEDEFHVSIDNYDVNKKLDNLIINDLNKEINKVKFHKITNDEQYSNSLLIEFKDDRNKYYKIFIKKYFESEDYRHIQIQIGDFLTISAKDMEAIYNSMIQSNKDYHLFITDTQKMDIHDSIHENNYYFIDTNTLNYSVEAVNFLSENLKKEKIIIKMSKFENDVLIQLKDPENTSLYSILYYKDYLINKDHFINMNFELNSRILMKNEDIKINLDELKNGEIIELEIN